MTTWIIDSEHDMETAIKYTVKLIHDLQGKKKLGFSFPSKGLSHIFLNNLAWTFHKAQIAPLTGLEIDIYIPEDEEEAPDGEDLFT